MCDHHDRDYPGVGKTPIEIEMFKGFRFAQSTSLKNRYTGQPVGEWQLCPKCNGSGKAMNFDNQIPMPTDTCDVCLGDKIIVRPLL